MRLRANPGFTVTQATSKSTAVSGEGECGVITMNNASLATNTSVSFTLNNSRIGAAGIPSVCIQSGATANSYLVCVDAVAAGSCRIHVRSISGGSLGEALVLGFVNVKNNN